MMISTKDMNEQQLEWWIDGTAEIMERRRLACGGGNGGGHVEQGDTSIA